MLLETSPPCVGAKWCQGSFPKFSWRGSGWKAAEDKSLVDYGAKRVSVSRDCIVGLDRGRQGGRQGGRVGFVTWFRQSIRVCLCTRLGPLILPSFTIRFKDEQYELFVLRSVVDLDRSPSFARSGTLSSGHSFLPAGLSKFHTHFRMEKV